MTAYKLTAKQEKRRDAEMKRHTFIAALDEHLTEAERNDNPLMADLYRTFLKPLREAGFVRSDGTLTITLDLTGKQ